MKQKLIELQGVIDIAIYDISALLSLSVIHRTNRLKISKDIVDLNSSTINWCDPTDVYRTLHPLTAEHTFFSSAQGTFTKIGHILEPRNKSL